MRIGRVLTCLGLALTVATTSAQADDLVGLITKTQIAYFIAMEKGAQASADSLGLKLQIFTGKDHDDYTSQVTAIESLIAAGAKGIAITPADPKAIAPTLQKARDAGILVIALDTPPDPIDSVDASYLTDNRLAGKLIGQWAKGHLGDAAATAKVALLDAFAAPITVDYMRDQGFMEGYGFDIKDPNVTGDEEDPRICGHFINGANEEGGRTAMEQALQKCPDLAVVYTVNEPAADGALAALKAAGRDDGSITMVSIDGGCNTMKNISAGTLGATAMQFPKLAAAHAMEAIAKFIKTGERPPTPTGLGFTNSGVELVTDKPVAGVASMDSTVGKTKCF